MRTTVRWNMKYNASSMAKVVEHMVFKLNNEVKL